MATEGYATLEIAKCGDCPFYHEDKDIMSNSYCRYGGGWGWGMSPTDDCYFKRTLAALKSLFKRTR